MPQQNASTQFDYAKSKNFSLIFSDGWCHDLKASLKINLKFIAKIVIHRLTVIH